MGLGVGRRLGSARASTGAADICGRLSTCTGSVKQVKDDAYVFCMDTVLAPDRAMGAIQAMTRQEVVDALLGKLQSR